MVEDTKRRARQQGRKRLKRAVLALLTLVVTVGVVVAVYDLGGGKDESVGTQGGEAQPAELSPAQQGRVGQLMRRLESNPKDVKTLVAIGNVYFGARDYDTAGGWMERAVRLQPGNATARLALGAAQFNLGATQEAQRSWQRVLAEDPKNVEAYYDLGFLYVSKDPPDMKRTKQMWGKVVELAPGTSVAKLVSTHLKGLEKAGDAQASPESKR